MWSWRGSPRSAGEPEHGVVHVEQPGGALGRDDDRRRVPGVRPLHPPPPATRRIGTQPGQHRGARGGEPDPGRRASSNAAISARRCGVGEHPRGLAQHRPDLAHHRRRGDVVADDVPDGDHDRPLGTRRGGEVDGVEPVAAHVVAHVRGLVAGGPVQARHRGQVGQHRPAATRAPPRSGSATCPPAPAPVPRTPRSSRSTTAPAGRRGGAGPSPTPRRRTGSALARAAAPPPRHAGPRSRR